MSTVAAPPLTHEQLWPSYPFPSDPSEAALSVLTQSNIRYHGLIHEIDPAQNQVILKDVTIFGNEDRPWTADPVPFVSLGGHIIKAAKIYEHVQEGNAAAQQQRMAARQQQQQQQQQAAHGFASGQEMNMWQRLQQQQQQQQQLAQRQHQEQAKPPQEVRFGGDAQVQHAQPAPIDPREFLAQFNKEQMQQPRPQGTPQPPTTPFSYLDAARASAAKGAMAQAMSHARSIGS